MKSATILGYYGHNNLGDAAMLEGIKFLLKKYLGINSYQVMTNARGLKIPYFDVSRVNKTDLFVLGGGELINRDRLYLPGFDWLQKIQVPKIIIGCGINDVTKPSEMLPSVMDSLETFVQVNVRDFHSYQLLRSCPSIKNNVYFDFDPSFALGMKYSLNFSHNDSIAIIPTDRTTKKYDPGILHLDIINTSKAILAKMLKEDKAKSIKLIAFGGDDNDDSKNCHQLQYYLFEHDICLKTEIFRPKNALEALSIIGSCRKVYTYRLHGIIFSYMLKLPCVSFDYHCKNVYQRDLLKFAKLPDIKKNTESSWEDIAKRFQ